MARILAKVLRRKMTSRVAKWHVPPGAAGTAISGCYVIGSGAGAARGEGARDERQGRAGRDEGPATRGEGCTTRGRASHPVAKRSVWTRAGARAPRLGRAADPPPPVSTRPGRTGGRRGTSRRREPRPRSALPGSRAAPREGWGRGTGGGRHRGRRGAGGWGGGWFRGRLWARPPRKDGGAGASRRRAGRGTRCGRGTWRRGPGRRRRRCDGAG